MEVRLVIPATRLSACTEYRITHFKMKKFLLGHNQLINF